MSTARACVTELIMPYAPTVASPASMTNQLLRITVSEASMTIWQIVPVTMKNRKLFVSNQLRNTMREMSNVMA